MATGKRRARRSRTQWQSLIERAAQSPLSIETFGLAGNRRVGRHAAGAPRLNLLTVQPLSAAIRAQFRLVETRRLQHHRKLLLTAQYTLGCRGQHSAVGILQGLGAPAVQSVLRDLRLAGKIRHADIVRGQHLGNDAGLEFREYFIAIDSRLDREPRGFAPRPLTANVRSPYRLPPVGRQPVSKPSATMMPHTHTQSPGRRRHLS